MADSWEAVTAPDVKLIIRLDEDDEGLKEYANTKWPKAWEFHVGASLAGAAQAWQWAFQKFPDEKCYGWLGDDAVLYTPGWVSVLEAQAQRWRVSYPDDGFQHENLATHPCCSGDFLRALGYWALPELKHYYCDTILHTLAKQLCLLQYCPDVLFEHMHPVAGKGKDDATYQRSMKSWQSDTAVYEEWLRTRARDDLRRIANAIRA